MSEVVEESVEEESEEAINLCSAVEEESEEAINLCSADNMSASLN
jgi:hypothetical protein